MARDIFGLSAAMVAPFAADGSADLPRLAHHYFCGLANIAPTMLREVIHGRRNSQREREPVDLILNHPVMPAVKVLVAHHHRDALYARTCLPLVSLDGAQAKHLAERFDAIVGAKADVP